MPGRPRAQAQEREPRRAVQPCGLLVVSAHTTATPTSRGAPRGLRGPEAAPVDLERRHRVPRHEVVGEREGQPELAGELGAEVARAEQPDRGLVAAPRHRGDAREGAGEEARAARRAAAGRSSADASSAAPQGERGELVGARRTPDPEVDPSGVQRLEHPELLGDRERRMVRQHHAAGADAYRRRGAATWAISTSGAELAIPGMLWCSATQCRQ